MSNIYLIENYLVCVVNPCVVAHFALSDVTALVTNARNLYDIEQTDNTANQYKLYFIIRLNMTLQ